MNKRNFKFYLTASEKIELHKWWSAKEDGVIGPGYGVNHYATDYESLKGAGVLIDLNLTGPFHRVYFYDGSKALISFETLAGKGMVVAPAEAVYFAVRLTAYDPAVEKAVIASPVSFIHHAYAVTPYYSKLEKKMAKDSGQEYYRESLSGSLKLVGKDFELVYGRDISTSFNLLVYLKGKRYFEATFAKTDCKFDFVKKTCEPNFKTKDLYGEILDRYDDKYDLVKMGLPLTSIECTKRPFVQIYCLGANAVTNVFNGQAWERDVSSPVDSEDDVKAVGFNKVVVLREIQVSGAKTPGVNGLYTEASVKIENDGKTSTFTAYKVEQGTRTHFIKLYSLLGLSTTAEIYVTGSDSPIYRNSISVNILPTAFDIRGSIQGQNFFGVQDDSDQAVVSADFVYDMYSRVVHNMEGQGNALRSDDFAMSNVSYKRVSPLSSYITDKSLLQSSDSSSESTIYGINDYEKYFTPEFLPGLPAGNKYVPIARSSWVNTSLWLKYDPSEFENIEKVYSAQFKLRDCFGIGHAIKGLLAKMGSTVTHEPDNESYSSFLYSKKQPVADIDRFYIYITQKSNAVRGTYDQAAQKAEASLKSIMDMLRDCFKCYWYIDNGKLKIEHISFFKNGLSYNPSSSYLDLTLLNDIFNSKPILYGQGGLAYDTSELTRKYSFAYADESQVPFSGVELEVNAPYVQADKKEDINVGEFSADIDYMQISADSVSQDGFALLCPAYSIGWPGVPATTKVLGLDIPVVQLADDGQIYETRIQNAYASWAYLAKLYSYDMPAANVTSNVLPSFAAKGLKEALTQTVTVPLIDDLGPYSAVKTDVGTARITSVTERFESGALELQLAYPLS